MTCPNCHSKANRRSRRRSIQDYLLSVVGVLPWRCTDCEIRYYARAIQPRHLFHAHCGICGNLELLRIAPKRVPGLLPVVGRLLGLPALRCEPCRHNFFSLRPLIRPERMERPLGVTHER